MSNQPTKPKKVEGLSLLDRLRIKHPVDLGMEIQGYIAKYLLEGTVDKKILVSCNGEFLGSALTINEAISIIGLMERHPRKDYDQSTIKTTYVYEEALKDTKMYEECMPKRFNKKTGIEMHGKRFYIIKKKPNGSSSGKVFCMYNWDTRNLIFAHHNRDLLVWFLGSRYKLIEEKDV